METLGASASRSESNVKIRLIGHCIICLKKLSTSPEKGPKEKIEAQDYPEAVPLSSVASPGFLTTFHEVWGILQNGSSSKRGNNGRDDEEVTVVTNGNRGLSSFGISLEQVVAAGSQISVTFSRTPTPTICHQCFNKILAVENMMRIVRHQVRDVERLVRESRKGDRLGGTAEQLQKTLQVFTLEVEAGEEGRLDFEDDNDNEKFENKVEEGKPKRKRGRPPRAKNSESCTSFADDSDKDDFEKSVEEEKPKRKRRRPPRSENSVDSADQEESSIDYQDNISSTSDEDKDDPDFQVKTEPPDQSEEEGDDRSNFSDEFMAAGSSAKSLKNSLKSPQSKSGSGLLNQRIRWQTLELSDEDIAKNWRILCKKPLKNGSVLVYYCAHGKHCPVKVRKKVMNNGAFTITTNGLEHCNHRDKGFGLTAEQKEFVMGCLGEGVTTPNYIMMSFKAKGVPVPRKEQLGAFLSRYRRSERNKT